MVQYPFRAFPSSASSRSRGTRSSSTTGPWGMRCVGSTLLLAALLLLLPATPVVAQDGELRIVPSAGVMVPTSILYRSDLPQSTAELGNAPVVSLGVHAMSRNFPLSVRVTLDRLDWFDTTVEGRFGGQVHPFTVPTAITLVTGDLLVHPFRWEGVAPYAFGGFGMKNYSFGSESPSDDGFGFNFPEDGTSGRIHYGVGAEFGLAGQTVGAEAGGNYNRFVLVDDSREATRSEDQHEFVLRVLLPLPLVTF